MIMKYKSFGKSGLKTSILSLGSWRNFGSRLSDSDTRKIIRSAIDQGITTFDTADVYGPAEEAMGRALKGVERRNIVLSSKCYWPMSENVNDRGLSRKHIRESVDSSLSRLGTDYVDLYICHRFDDDTPLLETIRTYDDLIREGKILYWGTSAWTSDQLTMAVETCDTYGFDRPIAEQAEYSLLHPEPARNGVTECVSRYGMGLMCWSPLAAGLLAGRNLTPVIEANSLLGSVSTGLSDKYHNARNIQRALRLKSECESRGVSMAAVALSWLIKQPEVSNIVVGVSSLDQLKTNISSVDFELDDSLLDFLLNLVDQE